MKTIKDLLREQNMPFDGAANGSVDVRDEETRDHINTLLSRATHGKFLTPYIGLERVAKSLANFHIPVPHQGMMEGDHGTIVIPVEQFGYKAGVNDSAQFIVKGEVDKDLTHGPHVEGEDNELIPEAETIDNFIYFEYEAGDCGMFDIFCQIVDQDELDEILEDLEAEANEDEDEELNEAAPTGKDFKVLGTYKKDGAWVGISHTIKSAKDADHARELARTKAGKKLDSYKAIRANLVKEEEKKEDPPFEPTPSTTNAKTPHNAAKRLAQKAMKQARENLKNNK